MEIKFPMTKFNNSDRASELQNNRFNKKIKVRVALTEGLSLEMHKHSLNKSSEDEEKVDIMDKS